jgi:hypothetical protein
MSGDINAAFFGEKGVAVLVLATVQHYTTPEHRELCYAGLKGRAEWHTRLDWLGYDLTSLWPEWPTACIACGIYGLWHMI